MKTKEEIVRKRLSKAIVTLNQIQVLMEDHFL